MTLGVQTATARRAVIQWAWARSRTSVIRAGTGIRSAPTSQPSRSSAVQVEGGPTREMPKVGAQMVGLMIGCGAEGGPAAAGGGAGLAGGKVPLAARLQQQRVALGCHKRRAPLGGCPFVAGAVLPGLTAGVGAVQVARAVAELDEVVWAALPAGVQRAGRHAGGLGPCRRRSPSCLHGADSLHDSPRGLQAAPGTWA